MNSIKHRYIVAAMTIALLGSFVSPVRCMNDDAHPAQARSEVLERYGAVDVNKEDYLGRFPLYVAAEKGDFQQVEQLLIAKADTEKGDSSCGATPLLAAAGFGHVRVVQLLLDRKANPNARTTYHGDTPLHQVASNSADSTSIGLLVKAKADVNAMDNHGRRPLDVAKEMRDLNLRLRDPKSPKSETVVHVLQRYEAKKIEGEGVQV